MTIQFSVNWTGLNDFSKQFSDVLKTKLEDFYGESMRVVVLDIVDGILSNRDIFGTPFPSLAPSTIARKGHDKALIDKGLFSDKYTYEEINQWQHDKGTITIKPLTSSASSSWGLLSRAINDTAVNSKGKRTRAKKGAKQDTPRDQVGEYLQMDDIRNGDKFYFFGISQLAEEAIMQIIEMKVSEVLAEM